MRDSQIRRTCPERCRRDGWTAARQLAFLGALIRTRSVTAAARAAGMSRESAYRLRKREPDGLFALSWARAMGPGPTRRTRAEVDEGHRLAISAACGPEARDLRLRPSDGQLRDLPSTAPAVRRVSVADGIGTPLRF